MTDVERVMLAAYDKDALQVRGAASVLLQFLGVAGVLITLRSVGCTPTINVT